MSIVEFLNARLDEDREWAEGVAATEARMSLDDRYLTVRQWLPAGFGKQHNDPWPLPSDPKRTLLEVAAKRKIIQLCVAYTEGNPPGDDTVEVTDEILCEMASTYSDHREYQKEWAL